MKAIVKKEAGASLVEYALLVALVAIVAIGAIQLLGEEVEERMSTVASAVAAS
jgi:pilus assembly protein Flp/PilA